MKSDPGRRGHVQTDSEADYDAWHYDDGDDDDDDDDD